MRRHASPILLAALILMAVPASAQYKSVHVEGSEPGKGTAITRGRDCFVITAKHVVGHPTATVIGESRRRSSATVEHRSEKPAIGEDIDLAVLRVADGTDICGVDSYVRLDIRALVAANTEGVFRVRDENGTEHQIPASLRLPVDSPTLSRTAPRIRVYSLTGQPMLAQGHSGAMFYIAGQPVGILTEVFTGGWPGALVLRLDRIVRELGESLPIELPSDREEMENEALARDVLRANLSALGAREVCVNLWRLAKWVARPDELPKYTSRRVSPDGGTTYDVPRLLLATRTTQVTNDPGQLSARTLVGRVPQTLELESSWRMAEDAVEGCLRSDARLEVGDMKALPDRITLSSKTTTWTLEATKGRNTRVNVWLDYVLGGINVRVSTR